jgi:hypothetical protein
MIGRLSGLFPPELRTEARWAGPGPRQSMSNHNPGWLNTNRFNGCPLAAFLSGEFH